MSSTRPPADMAFKLDDNKSEITSTNARVSRCPVFYPGTNNSLTYPKGMGLSAPGSAVGRPLFKAQTSAILLRARAMLRLLPRMALRAALPCAASVAAVCIATADDLRSECQVADVHADGEPAHVHADLRAIYSFLPDVHEIPEAEEKEIDATGGHEGYGELTPHGTSALLRLLPLCQQADAFYDLGSGSGVVGDEPPFEH